jgi:hypothetical protein
VALAAERLRYQTFAGTLERSDVYLSISHQSGRHGFKLGLGHAGNGSGSAPDGTTIGFVRKGDGTGATHATAGYDYSFSKRSAVYAYYSHLSNQRNGITDFAINSLGAQAGATSRAWSGWRHNSETFPCKKTHLPTKHSKTKFVLQLGHVYY